MSAILCRVGLHAWVQVSPPRRIQGREHSRYRTHYRCQTCRTMRTRTTRYPKGARH